MRKLSHDVGIPKEERFRIVVSAAVNQCYNSSTMLQIKKCKYSSPYDLHLTALFNLNIIEDFGV